MDDVVRNNIERFSGFASLYDTYRPEAPETVRALLIAYLGHEPDTVIDLGSGTGLSTFPWRHEARRVIGVEPNDDMRARAERRAKDLGADNVVFLPSVSTAIPCTDASADLVTCSQSFHWMEPQSTLCEVARVLRPGGVFAAYDCDWPPSCCLETDVAYDALLRCAEASIERHVPKQDQARKWPKEQHLDQIRASGVFSFAKEVVFHVETRLGADAFIGIALSQGQVQTALRRRLPDIEQELLAFETRVRAAFRDGEKPVWFSYRLRLGVKAAAST
ncbi:class I SAM-dependent methyltransferase [Alicyclobacillus acidocaldarius]|uniref:Methyltransferase type 11 n=1 Tax=Alicyclobacillus acidocaldarius (strain Tc-4-1) TaxID=1048834 RepID=F8IG47_ALIAT|nr:class I SAM-dependent methyltransferase [Alicyclobacillus acidocaldarius]AEJ44200.1 Methyltransferase type 11 [Alicyclobacillus acidocaldarius subsp. acidocaldarius Tc-4-1]